MLQLPPKVTNRFHVMGGECNYLLRVKPEAMRLEFVADEVRVRLWGQSFRTRWPGGRAGSHARLHAGGCACGRRRVPQGRTLAVWAPAPGG